MKRGTIAAVTGAAIVLALTLFPYDFRSGRPGRFDWNLIADRPLADVPLNVVLFVPLGFGLGRLWSRAGLLLAAVLATLFGGALSFAVENLQIALDRHPDVSDLLTNALGTGLGAVLAHRWGPAVEAKAGRLCDALRRRASSLGLAVASVLWLAAWTGAGAWLRRDVTLASWETHYPLLIGNEKTGERPWRGEVRELWLGPVTTPQVEITSYAPPQWLGGRAPSLGWRGARAADATRSPQVVGPDRWLESDGPLRDWLAGARERSAFGLGAELRSLARDQEGPARIVSFSESTWRRDLTIGQDGTDLVVRLRCDLTSANAHDPAFVVHDVFVDDGWHRVAVSFADSILHVAVDGALHAFRLNRWLKAIGDAFAIDAWDARAIDWLFFLLAGGPAAAGLLIAWRRRRITRFPRLPNAVMLA